MKKRSREMTALLASLALVLSVSDISAGGREGRRPRPVGPGTHKPVLSAAEAQRQGLGELRKRKAREAVAARQIAARQEMAERARARVRADLGGLVRGEAAGRTDLLGLQQREFDELLRAGREDFFLTQAKDQEYWHNISQHVQGLTMAAYDDCRSALLGTAAGLVWINFAQEYARYAAELALKHTEQVARETDDMVLQMVMPVPAVTPPIAGEAIAGEVANGSIRLWEDAVRILARAQGHAQEAERISAGHVADANTATDIALHAMTNAAQAARLSGRAWALMRIATDFSAMANRVADAAREGADENTLGAMLQQEDDSLVARLAEEAHIFAQRVDTSARQAGQAREANSPWDALEEMLKAASDAGVVVAISKTVAPAPDLREIVIEQPPLESAPLLRPRSPGTVHVAEPLPGEAQWETEPLVGWTLPAAEQWIGPVAVPEAVEPGAFPQALAPTVPAAGAMPNAVFVDQDAETIVPTPEELGYGATEALPVGP